MLLGINPGLDHDHKELKLLGHRLGHLLNIQLLHRHLNQLDQRLLRLVGSYSLLLTDPYTS